MILFFTAHVSLSPGHWKCEFHGPSIYDSQDDALYVKRKLFRFSHFWTTNPHGDPRGIKILYSSTNTSFARNTDPNLDEAWLLRTEKIVSIVHSFFLGKTKSGDHEALGQKTFLHLQERRSLASRPKGLRANKQLFREPDLETKKPYGRRNFIYPPILRLQERHGLI